MTKPRTSWGQRAMWVGAFVALTALLSWLLLVGDGSWDWDTYQRVQFMPFYRDDITADTHVLYHHVLRWMMAASIGPSTGIVILTAASAAAFLLLALRAAIHLELSRRAQLLVMLAASLASPGLVSLFLLREDNLPYIPILFALYFLLYRDDADRAAATRSGILGGVLVAIGMLLNISLLVLPIALVLPCLTWRWDPLRAYRAAVIIGVTFATYYLVHLTAFHGARLALHEFLPQAVALRDPTTSVPLVSLTRIDQYLGGLRAIALAPSVHMMHMPDALRFALVVVTPKLLALLYAAVLGEALVAQRRALWSGIRARLDLVAVAAIALGFPYLYEPVLIERWDVMWAGLILVLIVRLARRPSRLAIGLISAIIGVQSAGTLVTLAHHYGIAFTDPALDSRRTDMERILVENRDPIVLPFSIDRLHLAELATRTPGKTIFLVRDDATCVRVAFLQEHPVPIADARAALEKSRLPFLDPALSPHVRAALGR